MDGVRRAIATQLEDERNRQAAFRQGKGYAACRTAARRQFKVDDIELYLIDEIVEQNEDCMTLLVWPSAIFQCEVERETAIVRDVKLASLNDYMRTVRGTSAKCLATVIELARMDHKHR